MIKSDDTRVKVFARNAYERIIAVCMLMVLIVSQTACTFPEIMTGR